MKYGGIGDNTEGSAQQDSSLSGFSLNAETLVAAANDLAGLSSKSLAGFSVSSANNESFKSVTKLVLSGASSNNTLYGGSGNDTLSGNGGYDVLYGGGGNDLLRGGSGNDILYGQAGADTLFGGAGSDLLDGGDGIDTASYAGDYTGATVTLSNAAWQWVSFSAGYDKFVSVENVIGTSYADTLTGSAAANSLSGGSGNDTLTGGAGADTLTGGSGTDLFRYIARNEGRDTITDFTIGSDELGFNRAVFDAITASSFISGAGKIAATTASQRYLYDTTTRILRYDPDGSNAQAAVTVATLSGVNSLRSSDLQLFTA